MRRAVAVGIQQVRAGRAVVRQLQPFTVLIAVVPLQPQRLVDGDAQLFRRDDERVVLLRERPRRAAKSAEIVALAALPRHVLSGRDTPGFV
ncbi:hypothetical protein D3C71_1709390 [compost metagenome]